MTITARRFDRGGELLRAFVRPDGTVLAEGISVREGIHEYRQADGSVIRELVTRQAVQDSARTGARAPLTLEHPATGFVTPETIQTDGVGDVDGEVLVEEDEAQGGFARVKVAIRRKDAIDAYNDGIRELSWGYEAQIDPTPGEHPIYGRYDQAQVGREINHIALVPRGRAGPTVALRRDSVDADYVRPIQPSPGAGQRRDTHSQERPVKRLPLLLAALGIEQHFDTDEAAVDAAIAAAKPLKAKADAADADKQARADAERSKADVEAEMQTVKDAMAELQGQHDALSEELSGMKEEAQQKADAAEMDRLTALAGKVKVKVDGLDKTALRVAIAKTRLDSVTAETPPAYLDGILALIEKDGGKTRDDGADDDRYDFGKKRGDGQPDPRTDADDEFYNPHLDAADEARKSATTVGGAA